MWQLKKKEYKATGAGTDGMIRLFCSNLQFYNASQDCTFSHSNEQRHSNSIKTTFRFRPAVWKAAIRETGPWNYSNQKFRDVTNEPNATDQDCWFIRNDQLSWQKSRLILKLESYFLSIQNAIIHGGGSHRERCQWYIVDTGIVTELKSSSKCVSQLMSRLYKKCYYYCFPPLQHCNTITVIFTTTLANADRNPVKVPVLS